MSEPLLIELEVNERDNTLVRLLLAINHCRQSAFALDSSDGLVELELKKIKTMPAFSDDTCPICLEEIVIGDQIRILGCEHSFHTKCIDSWLRVRANCPMCKYIVQGS